MCETERPMNKNPLGKLNVLSLFSGCGGLDLGFAQLGAESFELLKIGNERRRPRGTCFNIIWANDMYPPSCKTYSINFDAEIYTVPEDPYIDESRIFQGDIAKISFADAVGLQRIDVILGGFPCQDFSVIRSPDKRLGIRVKRGRLYCHFVRALAWLQPKIFVAENVKGLVSANGGRAYQQILDDFQNLFVRWKEIEMEYKNHTFRKERLNARKLEGYEILFSGVVNFADIGVPQARRRLLIIGLRKDLFCQLEHPATIRQNLKKNLNGFRLKFSLFPLTPIETFHGQTLGSLQNEYQHTMMEYKENIENVKSKRKHIFFRTIWPRYSMDIWKDFIWLNKRIGEGHLLTAWHVRVSESSHSKILQELGYYGKPLDKAGEFEDESNTILKETNGVVERMKNIPPGENHEFVRDTEYHVTGLMSNIYRRVHPLKPSPTIIAKGGGGTWGYHYARSRQRLTNRERARLQTFPDSFIFKGTPSEVRTQLGEAVPPLASKVIAKNILEILAKVNQ